MEMLLGLERRRRRVVECVSVWLDGLVIQETRGVVLLDG